MVPRFFMPIFIGGVVVFLLLIFIFPGWFWDWLGRDIVGEYGDAPDGSKGMSTGYYTLPSPGAPVTTPVVAAGIPARFPTMNDNAGPYAEVVDQFYINSVPPPLPSPAGVPSVEEDADDPADPDGDSNLMPPRPSTPVIPDRDVEDQAGSFAPSMLVFLLGSTPSAQLITAIATLPTATVSGPAYWNVIVDFDQDGEWTPPEWVIEDVIVNLTPGANTMMVSPRFRWPTVGGGSFGLLAIPVWLRNMVTLDQLRATPGMRALWDGSGKPGGHSHGEVEDYFVEWRPVGPIIEEEEKKEFGGELPTLSNLIQLEGPETVGVGGQASIGLSAVPSSVMVLGVPGGNDGGGQASATDLVEVGGNAQVSTAEFAFSVSVSETTVTLNVEKAPAGAELLVCVHPQVALGGEGPRISSGCVVKVAE